MTIDLAIPAKIAFFDRLLEEAQSGRLPGIIVAYSYPGEVATDRLVYGGGTRSLMEDEVAEQGVLIRETIAVSMYIKAIQRPACDVKVTDELAHDVGIQIGKVLVNNPRLAGPYTWLGIATGMTDYSRTTDETISIISYQVRIGTRFSWLEDQENE